MELSHPAYHEQDGGRSWRMPVTISLLNAAAYVKGKKGDLLVYIYVCASFS